MELAWAAERAGKKVYHLEVGQPDLPAPPIAVEASKKALDDPRALRYGPCAGELETRQAAATAIYRRTGCYTEPQDVVVGVGVTGALTLLLSAILDIGDELLWPDPLWPNCAMACQLFGAKPIPYPTPSARGFLPDVREVESLITPRTRAIYACSPSNPTGKLLPKSVLADLLQLCRERGLFLISDEIYGEIVFDGREQVSALSLPALAEPQAHDHLIWLGGVSKSHAMTGFRVGLIRAPRWILPTLENLQEAFLSCGVPFAQRGAAAAWADPGSAAAVAAGTLVYQRRRDLALKALEEEGLRVPSALKPEGAFYMLVPCALPGPEDRSEQMCRELLEEEGVACAPGSGFGREGRNFLRLSFATADEDVYEGTRRLGRFLRRRGALEWWPGPS